MTSTSDFEAINFLGSVGYLTLSISTNLKANRLGRRKIRTLLSQYSVLALSDGRLIDTARSDIRSIDHAIDLLYAHVELILWLVAQNYTISATSIKWYSCKKLLHGNRLHLSRHSSQLQSAFDSVLEKEALVRADISFYQVS